MVDNDNDVANCGGLGMENDKVGSNIRRNKEVDLGAEDSESDLDEVYNETTSFIAPKQSKASSSYKNEDDNGKSSLYEHWKESYDEDQYDGDPYGNMKDEELEDAMGKKELCLQKRDTAYQCQVFTRKRVFTIPNTVYPTSAIRHQQIRRIHQLDTTYQPFHSEQRIEFYSLNSVSVPPNNTTYYVSSTKELITPFENPESAFRSKKRLYETPGLVESSSPELDLISDIQEHSTTKIMTETMEQYMSKTRGNYGLGVVRPKINDKTHFALKGQYLKELRENTFSGSEHEDANEQIEKVLEIVDLFHIPEHYLTDMQEVILFYNRLNVPTRQILDSKGVIPTKTAADAKIAIQEMVEYSLKWYNGTSLKSRSTKTSDRLASIQA
ncbi:hypothetical protein Tco_0774842 [Tanacetum coccineum]|uniref:Uncharacterized protein n=1 Tax=Tanacetum coccineum TaxID=301880 RepID=A0ABQ4ZS77_9ASTR